MNHFKYILSCTLCVILLTKCTSDAPRDPGKPPAKKDGGESAKPIEQAAKAREYSYQVVQELPHDVTAFTQGFLVHNGQFVESTGGYGTSSIRRVNITTGKIVALQAIEPRYFGEGVAVVDDKIYALTWLNQTGFIYNAKTLKQTSQFTYAGEGWGLTADGTNLYMSNGSHLITQRDPTTFQILRTISVKLNGIPCTHLNELEWIDGEIWANVWQKEYLVRIDPNSGVVSGVVNLDNILPPTRRTESTDVLNGIAFDSTTKSVYVTGKNWPAVFQIKVQ